MVEPRLARTNKGRTWGLPRRLLLESLLGLALTLLPDSSRALGFWKLMSLGLFPAFGWTLHLTPDLVANSHSLLPVSGESWVEEEASALD